MFHLNSGRLVLKQFIFCFIFGFLPLSVSADKASPYFGEGGKYSTAFYDHKKSRWGGRDCIKKQALRDIIDNTLALPVTNPVTGVTAPLIPGISVALRSPECGNFAYATGLRDIDAGKRVKQSTPMWIGSMTKLLVTALTLRMIEDGYFGDTDPNTILNSPVSEWLSAKQVRQLTVGSDPVAPKCVTDSSDVNAPQATFFSRITFTPNVLPIVCPDLSNITLRQLLNSNHGMADFVGEVLELDTGSPKLNELIFDELYIAQGIDPVLIESRPKNIKSGFDILKVVGLMQHPDAVIGGNQTSDFEPSAGNTGFQLMGVILEQQAGRRLGKLITQFIVRPLGLDPIFLPTSEIAQCRRVDRNGYWGQGWKPKYCRYSKEEQRAMRRLAKGYAFSDPLNVYSARDFNGHSLLDTRVYAGGRIEFLGSFGGAGGAATTMRSYAKFFDAMINGHLLSEASQIELLTYLDADPLTPGSRFQPINFPLEYSLGVFFQKRFPELPNITALNHSGAIEGGLCDNVVFKDLDKGKPLLAAAVCFNTLDSVFGGIFPTQLINQLFEKIQEGRVLTHE